MIYGHIQLGDEYLAAGARGITLISLMFDWDGRSVSDEQAVIVATSHGEFVVSEMGTWVLHDFVDDEKCDD